ncbi:FAD/NAD(P)-binding domain-containing protein [Whalleya microplaca]|nr:FAD/NAD(P)-binding domain-containing protein [Whalleya microplaca]
MSPNARTPPLYEEYPPKADLRKELCQPLPFIAPGTVDPTVMGDKEASKQASAVLDEFNLALETNDAKKLEMCFFGDQAYWRDILALTSHLRTFMTPGVIATALLETKKLREATGGMKLEGVANFVSVSPVLQFIHCSVVFRTYLPAATCTGRLMLLPTKVGGDSNGDTIAWKIWILSTWIDSLDVHPEDEDLLQSPSRKLDGVETIETDVLIIGGGNSGSTLAARLKALGVESVMIDKNPQVGDNWALRYDCLQLHVPTSSCEMPYLRYGKDLQTPHLLSKDELAEQLKKFVSAFNLNIITSVNVQSTIYDQVAKQWVVKFNTPNGDKKAVCKQLVCATGISSSKPYVPSITDEHLYKGVSLHSAQFKNAKLLVEQGAKTVLVIGSANTGFDIIEDCYDAGLQTTMIVRSPTYVFPMAYCFDPHGFGAYDHMPIDEADKMQLTSPMSVASQLAHGMLSHLSSTEPDRYKALAAAGFPVFDSRHPDANLMHFLVERGGGHYVDMDLGVRLIEEGKIGVKGGVSPVAYTETGLRFSDGSTVDTDAVVWCTGFAKIADTLCSDDATAPAAGNVENSLPKNVLGPRDIAARLDATWGLDAEGEIRGVWKRQLRMENYWVMGGTLQHQRWWSRVLAQQIKLAMEGILPPAYRDTPESVR